jgi:hypothetical protein
MSWSVQATGSLGVAGCRHWVGGHGVDYSSGCRTQSIANFGFHPLSDKKACNDRIGAHYWYMRVPRCSEYRSGDKLVSQRLSVQFSDPD